MIVYRVCAYSEVKEILENCSLDTVGRSGQELVRVQQSQNVSNHNYNYRKKYLHFYKDKSSIFYKNIDDVCICTYNIPDEILNDRIGEGYYLDLANQRRIVRVPEYAIDIDDLCFDYLEKVEYAREFIDFDDYCADPNLTDIVEIIYNKEKGIKRERRVS